MAGKEPLIIRDRDEMRKWSRSIRARGNSIGLVPTMGYLHQGHLSLVKEACNHANLVVVSIYVNPGQFSPNEDLSTYPSNFEGDIEKLRSIHGGVDVVFNPYNLYDYGVGEPGERMKKEEDEKSEKVVSCVDSSGFGHETWIRVENLEKGLCGKSRPVFFRGVATVVAKLFNIIEPDVAVFGKKDYQQWRIIQRMVRDLDFGIKIIGSELVREDDGLAMSSRNVRLSPQEREKVPSHPSIRIAMIDVGHWRKRKINDFNYKVCSKHISRALSISRSLYEAKRATENGELNCTKLRNDAVQAIQEAGGKVDYNEIVDQESLESVEVIQRPVVFCIAAWFGNVRLIDNIEINV